MGGRGGSRVLKVIVQDVYGGGERARGTQIIETTANTAVVSMI